MNRFIVCLGVAAGLLAASDRAHAQGARPERPYRGLFGSGVGDAGQSLGISLTLGAGYDDDLEAATRGRSGAGRTGSGARNGVLGTGGASLAYTLDTDAIDLATSVGTTTRYYPSAESGFLSSSQGMFRIGVAAGERTSLVFTSRVDHQPYAFSGMFPAMFAPDGTAATAVELDTTLSTDAFVAYSGTGSVGYQLSRRASISTNASYRSTNASAERRFARLMAGGGFNYNIGRGLTVNTGYGYNEAVYASGVTRINHSIDAGVNFNRALSFSRRTTLSFATGSSAVAVEDGLRYRATGTVALNHEIGRTFSATVSYGRRVILHENFDDVVLSDGVSAFFGGLINRRVSVFASAQGALGTVGVSRDGNNGFNSYYGTTGMSVAATRFMNVGLTYAYYHQRFDGGVGLPSNAVAAADRQSVRATVSLWAPLLSRSRRPNAAR